MWAFITFVFTWITGTVKTDIQTIINTLENQAMVNKAQFDELFARQDAAEAKHATQNTENSTKLDALAAEIAALKEQAAAGGLTAAEEEEVFARAKKNTEDYEALLAAQSTPEPEPEPVPESEPVPAPPGDAPPVG
jgi:septal ring factor EnvC (AmiA/AmiB activator)